MQPYQSVGGKFSHQQISIKGHDGTTVSDRDRDRTLVSCQVAGESEEIARSHTPDNKMWILESIIELYLLYRELD
jgi:hypothetical protein